MLILLALAVSLAQQPAAQLAFEVASVKPCPERTGEARYLKMFSDDRRIAYSNVHLQRVISYAFNVPIEN